MQVKSPPEGFERVVQFNVYVKNGSSNSKAMNNMKYTVRETREFDDKVQKSSSKESETVIKKERSDKEVEDIQNFLDKVRSESEREDEMREKDPKEETMFKPRRKTSDDRIGDKTQEKTPIDRRKEGTGFEESAGPRDRADPRDRTSNNRPGPTNLDHSLRQEEQMEDNNRLPSRDRYLEIFVKPKKGQPSLVYSHDGEPAEIIHRFTPRKDFDRRREQRDVSVSGFRYEEYDLPPNFLQPELNDPPQREKKHLVPRRKVSLDDREQMEDQYRRPERSPKPDVSQKRPPRDDPNDEEYEDVIRERERLSKKQRDLIRALEEEKDTLKSLVDRLTDTLEKRRDATPQQRPPVRQFEEDESDFQEEYKKPSPRVIKPVPPPKEKFVEVPRREKSKTPPIQKPRNQSKSPQRRADETLLSPAARRSPFDVRDGRTEWDRKSPYLKQMERLGRTAPAKQFDRGFEESDGKYSNEKNHFFQRNYERACRECGQTLDKDKFRREMEVERQTRGVNQRYSEHKEHSRPATYFIEGTLYGPVDPSRAREARDVIYRP